ncbi:adenosylcobinamide-GDP ribazoletransferase [Reinekea blandensis]|uniref:Adenosylcobinamide-GDP ribazoletransferase n=1 Tax=Reinekea blandensis MED297 TaxID=314283 RepID=A4BIB4_9GAMM|nr:adenosylcobinamide-GDP ribazoletransferase [Reinekea blandensis]EAR08121.1 cobalamin synthase [Reinekea sp. MED297] [Reinekea blandensis MED297]
MIHDFLLAVGYFTRIPVPAHPNFSETALKRSAVYFPLIGVLVGGALAVICLLAMMLWSTPVAVIVTLACGFLMTGAFHEDGWADTFDGFGGAFEREKKLSIMTDSRLGTYGSLALWAVLTLKALALIELVEVAGVLVFLLLHGLSRWGAMSAMIWLRYAKTEASKAKPVVQQLSFGRWLLSGLVLTPAFALWPPITMMTLLLSAALLTAVWLWLCYRQIGGYTGDTLGAGQQWLEVGLILTWLAL